MPQQRHECLPVPCCAGADEVKQCHQCFYVSGSVANLDGSSHTESSTHAAQSKGLESSDWAPYLERLPCGLRRSPWRRARQCICRKQDFSPHDTTERRSECSGCMQAGNVRAVPKNMPGAGHSCLRVFIQILQKKNSLVEALAVQHVRVAQQRGARRHADESILCKQRIDALRGAVQRRIMQAHPRVDAVKKHGVGALLQQPGDDGVIPVAGWKASVNVSQPPIVQPASSARQPCSPCAPATVTWPCKDKHRVCIRRSCCRPSRRQTSECLGTHPNLQANMSAVCPCMLRRLSMRLMSLGRHFRPAAARAASNVSTSSLR